ncbi:hypothetical protein ASD76_08335 [Altererythrobacter sp. Root672]|nr:hypothetical protein ASD76_08335 [Altererythrobacter sp. Root672]
MLKCRLPRGMVVELRHGTISIVGRVVWSGDGRCGIRTRCQVDQECLLGRRRKTRSNIEKPAAPAAHRTLTPVRIDAIADLSKRIAWFADWLIVAFAGIALAVMTAHLAMTTFEDALSRASAGLENGAHNR